MKRVSGAVLLKSMPVKGKKNSAGGKKSVQKAEKKILKTAKKAEKSGKMAFDKNLRSGTVPYLVEDDGTRVLENPKDRYRVMLVTPSGGGAWMLPKGNIEKNMTTYESAAKEAFEEAGVVGTCDPVMLGAYQFKQSQFVQIFPLRITRILDRWEETEKRSRFLFRLDKAAKVVDSDDIRSVLLKLRDYLAKQS